MKEDCICDSSSEYTEDKNEDSEEEMLQCNRIFLNFSREFSQSPKDCFKIAKVKDLFKYLSERQDLQEMKVSGRTDEEKPEEEETEKDEEEGEKDGLDSCEDVGGSSGSTPRGGGQRFAMSRDFWYRKLNTLKARKLDEVALEAKDIPPNHEQKGRGTDGVADEIKEKKAKDPYFVAKTSTEKVASPNLLEGKCLKQEIDLFTERVAKPVEKKLKNQFVNVYDNRKKFAK